MKIGGIGLISLFIQGIISSASYTGDKVLILTDKSFKAKDYSLFLHNLKERGYDVTLSGTQESDVKLMHFEQRLYDHLILFSPKTTSYGGGLSEQNVVEFVNEGGNLLLAANSDISKFYQNLGIQFGATFDEKNSYVKDPYHHNVTNTENEQQIILSDRIYAGNYNINSTLNSKILFSGVAHSVDINNPNIKSILKSSVNSYSSKSKVSDAPSLYGDEISLISAMQANNNARVTVFGSTDMFSDFFINFPVAERLDNDEISSAKDSINLEFIEQITQWNFQETGVIKSFGFNHHKVGEHSRPNNYRIKDEIKYSIKLAQYVNGTWTPFRADDIQIEIIMLDPYIRAYLTYEREESEGNNSYSIYSVNLTLPDVYGVFTFKVEYKRDGLSFINEKDVIPIHPFKHNEYPRFLTPAFPYYLSAASMAIGFVFFSTIWLFNRNVSKLEKKKNE